MTCGDIIVFDDASGRPTERAMRWHNVVLQFTKNKDNKRFTPLFCPVSNVSK